MAKLIYSAIASADGYVEDAAGHFDWAAPDDELFCFVNNLERPVPDGVRSELELLDTRRFASGAVYLRYRPQSA
jgi:hypothetical protein